MLAVSSRRAPGAQDVVTAVWRKDEIEAMVFILMVAVMLLVTSWTNGLIG